MWKTKSHRSKYKNTWMTTWEDEIKFSGQNDGIYGYIEVKDGAHVVVFDKTGKIILFKQYRYPAKKFFWSIPGGKIDNGEKPEETVKREAREEIGVEIEKVKQLGRNWISNSAFISERTYLFLALAKNAPSFGGQKDETIKEIKTFPPSVIFQMIDEGEIEDAYMANALQIACRAFTKR